MQSLAWSLLLSPCPSLPQILDKRALGFLLFSQFGTLQLPSWSQASKPRNTGSAPQICRDKPQTIIVANQDLCYLGSALSSSVGEKLGTTELSFQPLETAIRRDLVTVAVAVQVLATGGLWLVVPCVLSATVNVSPQIHRGLD